MAQGIATIAAAFYPREVIVRLSDYTSLQYASLVGGELFENIENNPLLGLRGAARYLSMGYRECFALECEALRRVRYDQGLVNLSIMVPFVRSLGEADKLNIVLETALDNLRVVVLIYSEAFSSLSSSMTSTRETGCTRPAKLLRAISIYSVPSKGLDTVP